MMSTRTRLLIVSDHPSDLDTLPVVVREGGVEPDVTNAASQQEFLDALANPPSLVICRYRVGDFSAIDALRLLRDHVPRIPLLVVGEELNLAVAEECIRLGAFDAIPADRAGRLPAAVRRALQTPAETSLVSSADLAAAAESTRHDETRDTSGFFFYRLRLVPDRALERVDGDYLALTGYTADELRADTALFLSILDLDDADLVEQGVSRRWSFKLQARDGSVYDAEQFTNILPGADGSPVALEGLVRDVTAHLQTAVTLQRSESNFRAAAESSLDAFYILRAVVNDAGQVADFVFTYANTRAESQFYLPREHLLGQRIGELFPILRSAGFLERYVQVLQTGQAYEGEYYFPDNGQTPGWYYQQVVPLDEGVAVTNRDITARKLLEASLRRSGNMFRWFVARSIDGMLLADEQGVIIAWNEAQEQITGLPRQEVIGRFAWDVVRRMLPPQRVREGLADEMQARLVEALRTGEGNWLNRLVETEVARPDGTRRVIQEAYFPLRTDKGYMIGNITRDITERRRMEEAMSTTAANLRAMLNNSSQSFILLDRNGVIQAHNDTALEHAQALFGRSFRVDEAMVEVLPTVERANFEKGLPRVLAGESVRQERSVTALDGKPYWFRVDFAPVATDEGKIIGACISALDITENREAEKRTLDLVIEREKLRVLETFINDASHDFRTPISILKTTSYLLGKFSDQLFKQSIRMGGHLFTITPETLSALLRDIGEIAIGIQKQVSSLEASTQRLEKLVESLLEITRLEHQPQFELELRSLNVLADGVVEMYRPLAAERHISLHLTVDDALPFVRVDEEEFSRVVHNLLDNALSFTAEGGQVFVKTYRQDEHAALEVADTGIGIPPADLPHIFERFFRADRARQATTGGAGLGLSIARRIVEAHGGHIEVSSQPGEGSVFRVLLPLGNAGEPGGPDTPSDAR